MPVPQAVLAELIAQTKRAAIEGADLPDPAAVAEAEHLQEIEQHRCGSSPTPASNSAKTCCNRW